MFICGVSQRAIYHAPPLDHPDIFQYVVRVYPCFQCPMFEFIIYVINNNIFCIVPTASSYQTSIVGPCQLCRLGHCGVMLLLLIYNIICVRGSVILDITRISLIAPNVSAERRAPVLSRRADHFW
jgi:hypothetical protein